MSYKFNPQNYGFEPIDRFPAVVQNYFVHGFVRVTCSSKYLDHPEYDPHQFWFKVCCKVNPIGSMGDHDDRWKIYSACLDMRNLVDLDRIGNKPTIEYNGIIPTHEFATELLINLMSALNNESVCHGLDRFQDHTQNGYFKAFSK